MVDPDKLAYAAHLRDSGSTIAEIVTKTGITRTSLYRDLPPRPPEPLTAAGTGKHTAKSSSSSPASSPADTRSTSTPPLHTEFEQCR